MDLLTEREFALARISPIAERLGYRSVLAVPLLLEDRVMGGLTVGGKAAGRLPPEVVDLLQTFAAQSSLALQNARLFREIADKSRELEVRESAQVGVPSPICPTSCGRRSTRSSGF